VTALAQRAGAPPAGGVARALARGDAWRLARHPSVLVGAALSGAAFALTGSQVGHAFTLLSGQGLLPLAVGTLLAAQQRASHDRRHRTVELETAAPTPAGTRTVAVLLALAGPLAVATCCLVVGWVAAAGWAGLPVALPDGIARVQLTPVEVAQGVVGVALFGAIGVALGTWVPRWALRPLLLLILAAAATTGLGVQPGTHPVDEGGWMPWVLPFAHHATGVVDVIRTPDGGWYEVVEGYDRVALAWHVGYVASLATCVGCLAVLRRARSARLVAVALTSAGAAALAFVAQLR
jgi:hypothetical protein